MYIISISFYIYVCGICYLKFVSGICFIRQKIESSILNHKYQIETVSQFIIERMFWFLTDFFFSEQTIIDILIRTRNWNNITWNRDTICMHFCVQLFQVFQVIFVSRSLRIVISIRAFHCNRTILSATICICGTIPSSYFYQRHLWRNNEFSGIFSKDIGNWSPRIWLNFLDPKSSRYEVLDDMINPFTSDSIMINLKLKFKYVDNFTIIWRNLNSY